MEEQVGVFTSIAAALANPLKVDTLDLQNQDLIRVPAEVFQFPNLRVLNLNNNLLEELPVEFANLPIQELGLSKNEFKEFPRFICAMRRLEALDISYNNIRYIPDDISYLSEILQYLNMKDNLLDEQDELQLISFLPNTDINFSLVKSYDPSRTMERNWTHNEDKKPFKWRLFWSWMAVPVVIIFLTIVLRVIYKQFNPIPYEPEPRIEEVFPAS